MVRLGSLLLGDLLAVRVAGVVLILLSCKVVRLVRLHAYSTERWDVQRTPMSCIFETRKKVMLEAARKGHKGFRICRTRYIRRHILRKACGGDVQEWARRGVQGKPLQRVYDKTNAREF